LINKPRGTEDILPKDSALWRKIENTIHEVCENFGYGEIRTPTFEATELFERGVGDTTDVVQKEMYTFLDKGERSMTLRPEGTASVVRAFLENSLYANPQPTKLYYIIPCYRYEKPQAGRLREFHQFGVEVFGAARATVDVEVISLAVNLLERLGVSGVELNINSIGCPDCRPSYNEKLRAHFEARKDKLCETCLGRLEKNPMRIIDCKSPVCGEIAQGAPKVSDHLCESCETHFSSVKSGLDNLSITYNIDPNIVRGLDYYTKTVFELTSNALGAQSALCGGGRYDGLVTTLGGSETPAIGFAMGLERLVRILGQQQEAETNGCDLFITTIGDVALQAAEKLAYTLRQSGKSVQIDLLGRSVKAQMKYADKIGAKYSVVLGDDELGEDKRVKHIVNLKNMQTGETKEDVLIAELVNTSDWGTFFNE